MPVGELTVTQQDIACLWGLPIDGIPIIDIFYSDWMDLTV
jgi:Plant mobile domain